MEALELIGLTRLSRQPPSSRRVLGFVISSSESAFFLRWTGWVKLPILKKEKIPSGPKIENRKDADGNSADGHRTDADIAIYASSTPALLHGV